MEWFDCKYSLPAVGLDVLIVEQYRDIKTIKVGHRSSYDDDDWIDDHCYPIDKATYWMLLPEFPKDE